MGRRHARAIPGSGTGSDAARKRHRTSGRVCCGHACVLSSPPGAEAAARAVTLARRLSCEMRGGDSAPRGHFSTAESSGGAAGRGERAVCLSVCTEACNMLMAAGYA